MSEYELKYKVLVKMIKKLIERKTSYVDAESLVQIIEVFEEVEEKKVEEKKVEEDF